MSAVGPPGAGILTEVMAVQPFISVAVTTYEPPIRPVACWEFWPFDHK